MNVRNVIEKKNLFHLMMGFNAIKYLSNDSIQQVSNLTNCVNNKLKEESMIKISEVLEGKVKSYYKETFIHL